MALAAVRPFRMPAPDKSTSAIMYRVGKHSPGLHTYPLWARWLVRLVYFWTGYQVTSQDIGIATSKEMAESMCLNESYFYKPLFVDFPLPEEQCAPGATVWPHSEAKTLYERYQPDGIYLTKEEFNSLQGAVKRLCSQ
jgi:hypothetical protein